MGSPLPPDPYIALGVSKDADQAAIKTAHRKLVLKCHPDKVTDPAAKQAASDQFHKIQTAYEILVDQDRRERYDAQVRLAELRKEAMERQGGKSTRGADRSGPSHYKSSHDSAAPRGSYNVRGGERMAPQYEERRPAYAADYFDTPPRATARKEADYERSFRRPAADSKDKLRAAARETKEKEAEKERRREKARRAEQDARRGRDRKPSAAYIEDDESESDSDEYTRRTRKMREEDELRMARDAYNEKVYKQKQEASNGQFDDARTKKMFAATSNAWDYIRASGRRPESGRPEPVRQGSSKEKFDFVKGKDGRSPVVVRRGSERPKTSSRDEPSRRTSPREPERRSSAETMDDVRRAPPPLNSSRSSPADIRLPGMDKPRAQSVQVDKETYSEIPQVKRAETMPYQSSPSRRVENTAPQRGRSTEFTEGLATPATTPEYTGQTAPNPAKFGYGRQYADDREYPTPDGYRTEVRQPGDPARPRVARKVTQSPSPMEEARDARDARDPRDMRDSRERERERPRTTSSRHPEPSRPVLPNTRTKSYVYTPGATGVEQIDRSRPSSGRGLDSRDPRQPLYGEIRQPAASPRQNYSAYEAPEEPSVRYSRPLQADNIKYQSGYNYRRPSTDRPVMPSRNGSGNPVYTQVRA